MTTHVPDASFLALFAPVQWIVDLLKPALVFFHDSIGVGWGMSIVFLTVVARALLAPLTARHFKSMQAIVRVAPEVKAMQAKHKDDRQRQQQELMKLYAENKINPFASFLPLVAQMPLFIGLFYLLQDNLRREICGKALQAADKLQPCGQLKGASGAQDFLFIPDLTGNATGWVLGVLIVLYLGSQLLSSVLTPSTAGRKQRMVMYGLPFVFVIPLTTFPAGLIVYWITTNVWTVTQGYVLRRHMGSISAPKAEPALADVPIGSTRGDRGGGFMARLAGIPGASAGDTPPTRSPGTSARPDAAKPARNGPPPQPPRKKKKRSGRRR